MKAGLVTSLTLHTTLIGFALFSLSAPGAYEVADVESLPVDIIPFEDIAQVQEGVREAELNENPAPAPTRRPDPVEDAQRVGEADTDTDGPPTPEPEPKPVEQAAQEQPAPEAEPVEEMAQDDATAEAEETEVAATEREPEAQLPQEVTEAPASDPLVAENAEEESVQLPDSVPLPQARPEPPKPQTARAPEPKETRETAEEQSARDSDSEELFDEVAALLNKEDASGGGARRSREEASLGSDRTTGGETLTQSEMDALRGQIQRCWNVPAGAQGAENLRVSLKFSLNPSGEVEGTPQITEGGGGSGVMRAAAESARRAILRCAPYELPAEKYDAWADVIVNFDPRDMF
ncbi:hypothetical protein [Chelativorans sp. YIM 93263]|uniref:hypothetical protein n=1 Tax=Chelativorans sp. YIM 93263 TaxID=2906648 RepID=UPI00237962A9|nr:hypothetical protein [Chelativorans sp. YIM 93263]